MIMMILCLSFIGKKKVQGDLGAFIRMITVNTWCQRFGMKNNLPLLVWTILVQSR